MTTFDQQFQKAWKIITPVGKVTVSYLQRKMGIGWNRAAKIVDEMEKRGIIGPILNLNLTLYLKNIREINNVTTRFDYA